MRARLNRQFLDGSESFVDLRKPIVSLSYIPKDENKEIEERGVPEFILSYDSEIPIRSEEPDLYGIPHYSHRMGEDYWLCFPLATVILLTEKSDRKFRKENPDLVKRSEALWVF